MIDRVLDSAGVAGVDLRRLRHCLPGNTVGDLRRTCPAGVHRVDRDRARARWGSVDESPATAPCRDPTRAGGGLWSDQPGDLPRHPHAIDAVPASRLGMVVRAAHLGHVDPARCLLVHAALRRDVERKFTVDPAWRSRRALCRARLAGGFYREGPPDCARRRRTLVSAAVGSSPSCAALPDTGRAAVRFHPDHLPSAVAGGRWAPQLVSTARPCLAPRRIGGAHARRCNRCPHSCATLGCDGAFARQRPSRIHPEGWGSVTVSIHGSSPRLSTSRTAISCLRSGMRSSGRPSPPGRRTRGIDTVAI